MSDPRETSPDRETRDRFLSGPRGREDRERSGDPCVGARASRDPARDEMVDSERDLAPGRLGDYLRHCCEKLYPRYDRADALALFWQQSYRDLIRVAAWLTTATLLADACQLAFVAHLPHGFARIEIPLAIASAVVVGFALHGEWQKEWLLRRYQAERFRLLKFRMLTDPNLWVPHPHRDWRATLDGEIDGIGRLQHGNLEAEAEQDDVAKLYPAGAAGPDREEVSRLLEYYLRRRLAVQIRYFEQAAGRSRSVLLNPLWVPLVFFVSLSLVVVHFVAEEFGGLEAKSLGNRALAVVPVLLPALLTGARLRVTANELARNRERSLARKSALEEIARRLGAIDPKEIVALVQAVRETREPPGVRISRSVSAEMDAPAVISEIALAEQVLGSDQREWLRLMLEAEWYK